MGQPEQQAAQPTTDACVGPGWVVYIVRCADRTLYTGITNDLAARLECHNAGSGAKYTRSRRPVHLVYLEAATDRGAAQRREYEIRSLTASGKQELIESAGAVGG